MFKTYTHSVIDTVQDIKLNAVDHFVPHSDIKHCLKTWVNAQREYTKSAADAISGGMIALGSSMTRPQFYHELQHHWTELFSPTTRRK